MLAPNSHVEQNYANQARKERMAPHAIVSYDDTPNDHDALMLGRVLREAGAKLTLAYVRHATHPRSDCEELAAHEAEALLERGARWLDDSSSSAASSSTPRPARAWAARRRSRPT